MTEDQKSGVNLVLSLLKTTMKECDLHFAIVVDKKNPDNSMIAFLDKKELEKGNMDGIQISIDEMNRR